MLTTRPPKPLTETLTKANVAQKLTFSGFVNLVFINLVGFLGWGSADHKACAHTEHTHTHTQRETEQTYIHDHTVI
jgi:hypothetical protein